jgi:hypothetical protein
MREEDALLCIVESNTIINVSLVRARSGERAGSPRGLGWAGWAFAGIVPCVATNMNFESCLVVGF